MSTRIPRFGRRPHGKLYATILNKRFRSFLALSLAALIFASSPLGLVVSAREKGSNGAKASANSSSAVVHNHEGGADAHLKSQTADVDAFIIEMVGDVATCREATPAEVPLTLPNPNEQGIPVKDLVPVTGPGERAHAEGQGGEEVNVPLTINLVALGQLQTLANKDEVIAAFQKAAQVWTSRIKSPTTVTVNIDYGPNFPGSPTPFGDSTLGATSSRRVSVDYPGFLTNLKASSNGPAETAIYNGLPNGFLPADTGNGGLVSLTRALGRSLGINSTTTAPEDATIGFNSAFPFDFNPDDGIDPDKTDFVAVAAHEIGHALGFTSGAGQGATAAPAAWDVFRFRTGTTAGTFGTANRILSIGGGLQFYYTGQTFQNYTVPTQTSIAVKNGVNVSELGVSTGGPGGTTAGGGDGRQSSHWKADEQAGLFVGLMDPTISKGVKETPTDNDYALLENIGWDLTGNAVIPPPPPAPPAPANDNFANAVPLSGCSGTLSGATVGATRETGEQNHSPDNGGSTRSVWYQWTPTSTNSVTITTAGSNYDTVLGVYTGSSLNALTAVQKNDDVNPGVEVTSTVTFTAQAGTVYRIAVDGYSGSSAGDFGTFKLNWDQAGCSVTPPPGGGTTVGFNATSGQFFENDPLGYMAISVSRSNTSGAASVDYATSDGSGLTPCQTNTSNNASDRCDYATAIGTLRFANGEQTKTIQIPLINDIYVEPVQTFTLTLRNPQGLTITGPTAINLTIVDDDTAGANPPNPILDQEFFIKELYVDFLGRVAEPAGLAFWMNRMNNCPAGQICDRIDTAKRFFESDEFSERGFHVYRLYDVVLGRFPLYAEFVPDVARLNGFQTVAEQRANKDAYNADFLKKTEFRTKYGTFVNADGTLVAGQATNFVNALVTQSGLTIPNASRTTLINNLQSGARTPAQTVEDFILLPEISNPGTRYYDRARIVMQYFGFLRRDPEAGGFDFWWDQLTNPARGHLQDYRFMVGGFINSDEFKFRFAQQ